MKTELGGAGAVSTDERLARAERLLALCESFWCWMKPACQFCCWAYAVVGILGMLLVMHSAERVTLLAVANYAPPILWLIPCTGLIPLALVIRGYAMLPMVAILLFWWFGFVGWEPPGLERDREKKSDSLTLITYNRGQAQGHSLQPFLAATAPDLVALQDAHGKPGYYRTHPAYGVYQEVRDEGEFVLLSQHPVLAQNKLTAVGFPSADQTEVLYGVRWEIRWNGQAIALYNVHFPSPRRYLGHTGLRSLLPEVARLLGGAASDSNSYWHWREQMAQELARRLQKERLPWIMAGDLNTPPRGLVYACLAEAGRDLHRECGAGFGFTFPGDTRNPLVGGQPWMRLDYVFADSKFWQGNWLRPELGGRSQHRPVAAALHIRQQ